MTDNQRYLKHALIGLERARIVLEYSHSKCSKFDFDQELSMEELDDLEALTSKFARLSDIIVKKIINAIELVEFEDQSKYVLDIIAAMAKKGFIDNEDVFFTIREKRNTIAHEYVLTQEELIDLFQFVVDHCHVLFNCTQKIQDHCKKLFSES